MNKSERIHWVDSLRGMAILAMVIFHILFDFSYSGLTAINTETGLPHLLARFSQITFLTLVGFSLYLSFRKCKKYILFLKKQIRRSTFILLCALLITITTYFLYPEVYIRFGVLHFIGLAIIIGSLIMPVKSLVFLSIFLSPFAHFYFSSLSTNNPFLLPFGAYSETFASLDYFPFFLWFPLVCIGMLIAELLDKKSLMGKFNLLSYSPLSYIGKRSLLIYLIHQPIIIFTIYLIKVIKSI